MNGLFASRACHVTASASRMPFCPLLIVALLAAPIASSSNVWAQACTKGNRTQDEIWFVDTRGAACSSQSAQALPKVTVQRVSVSHSWHRAQLSDLLAADPSVQTIIWVHGNRISSSESRQRGWEVYHTLTRQADARPVRMIIWSWPADQIRGPIKDVRYKASLTVPAAYQLAKFLRHLDAETPVGLIGFSYGARVITGAMHLQAGGSLGSYRLTKPAGIVGPTPRVVLWASAINNDWLMPGHFHGEALDQLEYATFLNNSCDRALKRYRFIDRCTRPEAIGYWGVAGVNYLGENRSKVKQLDVACLIGKVHTDSSYIYSTSVMRHTWRGLAEPHAVSLTVEPAKSQNGTVAKK